jgi:hypothetical protein
LKSFTDALKTSNAGKDPNPMEARFGDFSTALASSLSAPNGEANVVAMITQIMATNSAPAVQETGKALLAELEARRKARIDALTTKVSAVLNRVSNILIKAQKPQDLDEILGSIQKLQAPQGGAYGYDQEAQGIMNQVNSAYQFVAQWQDYLSSRNSGNVQEAQNSLRNLTNSRPAGDVVLVPRSEILARITELANAPKPPNNGPVPPSPNSSSADVPAALNNIKTLEDLAPALKSLRVSTNGQGYDYAALAQLANLYANAKVGLPVSLDLNPPNIGGQPVPEMTRVRVMLLMYLLPRFIGSNAPAPKPDETVSDYLKRALVATNAAQDWPAFQLTLEAQFKVVGGNGYSPGTRSFLAGLNQEIAGQYSLAVSSYQTALQSPDDSLPTTVVRDHLAAIKKDHATEFDEGMKRFLNPPQPQPFYFNPYAGRPGMPGYVPVPAPVVAPVASPVSTNAAPVARIPSSSPAPTNVAPAGAPVPPASTNAAPTGAVPPTK